MNKKWILISLSLTASVLSGCSGMRMNTAHLTPVVDANNEIVTQNIQVIDAAYIQRIRQQKKLSCQNEKKKYRRPRGFSAKTRFYHYRIAAQDILQITVWNQDAESQQASIPSAGGLPSGVSVQSAGTQGKLANDQFIVNSSGSIFYPFLGEIAVQGKTVNQIRELISKKMSHYFSNPQVTVNVVGFNSQHIAVTGAVLKPTMIPITNVPLTVLDAVTQAGGPIQCGAVSTTNVNTLCADLHDVTITRGKKTVSIDLNQLTAVDGSSNNWILKNKDIVRVANNNASRVFVLGSVNEPSAYNMVDGKMTLREALGDARGAAVGSNPAFTYVIRDYQKNPRIFLLNLSSPDALNLAGEFDLKPGDVVYVSSSLLHSFNGVLNDVTPTLLAAVSVKAIS